VGACSKAVGNLDLDAFYACYRVDGHGPAAHDPAMMVALFISLRVNQQPVAALAA
jgi:hypothetical protein